MEPERSSFRGDDVNSGASLDDISVSIAMRREETANRLLGVTVGSIHITRESIIHQKLIIILPQTTPAERVSGHPLSYHPSKAQSSIRLSTPVHRTLFIQGGLLPLP